MPASATPPFRADHIGSLLRPKDLTQAYRARNEGKMSEAEFRKAQDKAVRAIVALQEKLGFKVVTDGEFRRASYWSHWIDAVDGLSVGESLFKFHDERGTEQTFICPVCKGRLEKVAPISTAEFKFLKSVAKGEPKITMPSPSTFHFWRGDRGLQGSGYASAAAFYDDLSAIYRREIADLAALGCRYVQLDEVAVAILCDPAAREKVKAAGEDPDRLVDLYIGAINEAVKNRPAGVTVGVHVCRGNYKGMYLSEGGYDSVAERFFGGTKLTTTASVESGLRTTGIIRNQGAIMTNIRGIMSDCASRMSLTAAPMAIMSDPIVKNAIKKKMSKYSSNDRSRRPNNENAASTASPTPR